MGSNNCSNVYVYAHTNPGPSSSPSIRGDSRFSYESHNEFRLFQLIGKAAVLWLTWVYLFRIILIAQLRKYSPPVFTSAKKKKTADHCMPSLQISLRITFFTHCFSFESEHLRFSRMRTNLQVRKFPRAIFHLAGRISRSDPGAIEGENAHWSLFKGHVW